MNRIWLLIGAACALASCANQAQRASERATIDAADDQTCRGYGVLPGSDAYVACRVNLTNNRTTINAASQMSPNNGGLVGAFRQTPNQ